MTNDPTESMVGSSDGSMDRERACTNHGEEVVPLVIPVLMYHSVAPQPQDFNSVTEQAFIEQIRILRSDWRPMTLDECLEAERRKKCPDGAVLVTFDDGYADLMQFAVPHLVRYAIPAVFFPVLAYLGMEDDWNPRAYVVRRHLSARDVAELATVPTFAIGAHGFTHQRLTRFPPYRITAEMVGAKVGFERLTGRPVLSYAYPFGGFDDRVSAIAREHFHVAFAAANEGTWDWAIDPFRIRRLYVGPTVSPTGFSRLLAKPRVERGSAAS